MSNRLEELQAKGWKKLNKEERKEFQALKGHGEGEAPPSGEPLVKPASDTVTIKKSELQAMINEGIENYRKFQPPVTVSTGDWQEVEPGKKANQTATLRLYQKDGASPYGAVIRSDYFKTVWNEETHKYNKVLYSVEVLYDDGHIDKFEMPVEEYLKLNKAEVVEIIDVDRKQMRQVTGKVEIPMRDARGYPIIKMNAGGYGRAGGSMGTKDVEVIRYEENFTVKRPNGQTFKIHSKYLNN